MTKENLNSKTEKYNSALSLLFYEGEIAWQMNLLFIGLNVGIGTIIGNSLVKIDDNQFLLLTFSILGIIINTAWLCTFRRNNKYYHFRMAQARNAEPKKWKLLRKDGYNFSKGIEVIIDNKGIKHKDKLHKLNKFDQLASNKRAIEIPIFLFILAFFLLLGLCIHSVFR
jgi:hypothetical protein